MLVIWDIHVTSKYVQTIIDQIQLHVDKHPHQKNIIFVGDYVYHFNYDRKSLLMIYDFFVDLYESGKTLYILAWNHDWISWNFVFQEWKRAFDLINTDERWIYFITEPTQVTIEWQECLMLPYYTPPVDTYTTNAFDDLLSSEHSKEQISWRINSILTDQVQERRSSSSTTSSILRVFHHWYMVGTKFPWQFASFSYKSPGLSKQFFEVDDIRLISWHLHRPFVHRNYLCVWSTRHTSPLEINQQKYLFVLEADSHETQAHHLQINPYLQIQSEQIVDKSLVDHTIQTLKHEQEELFDDWDWTVQTHYDSDTQLQKHSLSIQSQKPYSDMEELVTTELLQEVQDVKIKKYTKSLAEIVHSLDSSSKELEYRISDRKDLLKQYIEQKYPSESWKYLLQLEKMDILK